MFVERKKEEKSIGCVKLVDAFRVYIREQDLF